MIALVAVLALSANDPELEASVRVSLKNPASGTVINFINGDAYVLTIGHINNRQDVSVEFLFMDGDRLAKPMQRQGRIIFLVENSQKGLDCAVIKVPLPNRCRPTYIPLAAKAVRCREGQEYRTIACQADKPPCEFNVTFRKEKDGSLVTSQDVRWSSGGGLFRGGKMLGVHWGVVNQEGMFTPHFRIIDMLEAANLEFLLE